MNTSSDTLYMQRCFQLARSGAGNVAPNPMVGAVLVYENRIIGEGYHQKYGEAHAEVNCINNALKNHPDKIAQSTLYVSLEPCAHYGKTPPCAELIIKHKIPKVVIGCLDRFEAVNGRGVELLRAAGIEVVISPEQDIAIALNKRFFTFHQLKRPYIILKWAQTKNGIIGTGSTERLLITNEITNSLVHKWRTEEAGIMIGAGTAIKDDPVLDNRNWFGSAPVKIIISASGAIPHTLKMFQAGTSTLIFNNAREEKNTSFEFVKIEPANFLSGTLKSLHERNIQSILLEGGQKLLQSFINAGLWDEARIITNTKLISNTGIIAPQLSGSALIKTQHVLTDEVAYYSNKNNRFFKNNG